MYSILACNVQNHVGFWGSAPDPAGELTTLPRPPSREGLLAFGICSFAPSALNPPLAPQTKIPAQLAAPKTQNPRTATVLFISSSICLPPSNAMNLKDRNYLGV